MSKVITILLLILAGLYWAQTQKLKAMAIQMARKRCKESGVQFLDHTVVHTGKRIMRGAGECSESIYLSLLHQVKVVIKGKLFF